jgi:hypothetical protein
VVNAKTFVKLLLLLTSFLGSVQLFQFADSDIDKYVETIKFLVFALRQMTIGSVLLSRPKSWAWSGRVEGGVQVAIEDQSGLRQFSTFQLFPRRFGRRHGFLKR